MNIAPPTLDYGDSSVLGSVASSANGNLRLGALVDTEYIPTTNVTASGVDTTGSDDEDGVTIPTITAGAPAVIPVVVTNNTGAAAFLNALIDFNNDGDVADAGEQLATDISVGNGTTNGTVNLSFTVPFTAVSGANVALRFRLTNTSTPRITGTVGNGEVEDYVTRIAVRGGQIDKNADTRTRAEGNANPPPDIARRQGLAIGNAIVKKPVQRYIECDAGDLHAELSMRFDQSLPDLDLRRLQLANEGRVDSVSIV